MKKEEWISRTYGATSGLLLAIPQIWAIAAPLQLIALLPILYLTSQLAVTYRKVLYAGVYMGIFYVLPQAFVLRMPLWITISLLAELIIVFTIFALLSHRLFLKPSLTGTIAIGASLVLLDWLNFTAIPIWGTAQSIVRPWSDYPSLISFVSVSGLTGIIFLLGFLQGLIINMIICKKQRLKFLSAAIVILFAFATINLILQTEKPETKIKVSAIGWDDSNSISYPENADSEYAQLVNQAAYNGSKIVSI